MFERFTQSAREVVTSAIEHSGRVGAGRVEPEHMLLALMDRKGTRAASALASLGISGEGRGAVETALEAARRRGGLSESDTEALAGLGIDLTRIVERVEAAHGVGALDGERRRARGGGRSRPFSREAKDVLARTLLITKGQGDRHIGDEHILLALVAGPGVVSDVLAKRGATYGAVHRALYGADGTRG
ncbi:Clp protease N-terminal domain-containing protein [Streptomyces tsukubensis]|uniref:Peptidase n=1 Tax=Streptomyces tsukubensis TaxID=83656 RepID=A0A1V4ABY9_9ACTN|nr:Clp protease N-terminal domain-containing protein [Streptomyces tsukubensis]OON81204.1 peptidase [Streptomyces tsukubensis]QFR95684.1 peptidase [Streptomyces tsukubensis]